MDLHTFRVIKCGSENFVIDVNFEGDSLKLIVLKGLTAWSARVNLTELEHLSKTFQLSPREYFDTLKEYFTVPIENIELKLENDSLVMCRIEENFNVKYFTWKMLKIDFQDCVNQLLEKFYVNWDGSKLQCAKDSEEIAELRKRNSELEAKLDEFVERKQKDERTLLNNFCLVLNEKKRRIQHLNELLVAFRKGRPTVNPPAPIKKKKIKSEAVDVKSNVSESEPEENDSEYNTDEEETAKNDFVENAVTSKPSTSKIDDENEELELTTLPKRQKVEEKSGNNRNRFMFSSMKNKVKSETRENSEVVEKEENVPSINFDTQDLLDNM